MCDIELYFCYHKHKGASHLLVWTFKALKVVMIYLSFPQPDDLLSSKIQSLCPTITGNVCCTEAQFETLRTQVQQVKFSLCLSLSFFLFFFFNYRCIFVMFKIWVDLTVSLSLSLFLYILWNYGYLYIDWLITVCLYMFIHLSSWYATIF